MDAPALAAIVMLVLGFPERARELMSEALRRAERTEGSASQAVDRHASQFRAATVHMWGGMLSWHLRDPKAALEHAQALRHVAITQPVWTGLADANLAKTLMLRGEWDEGVSVLRKATAHYKSVGLASFPTWAKLDEVEFFSRQGLVSEGLKLVAEVIAEVEELAHLRSPALRQRADLLAQNNAESSLVQAAYRAAIECARSQDAKYYELQAATAFVRWMKSQDRANEARPILADIYNWFSEGFDTVA